MKILMAFLLVGVIFVMEYGEDDCVTCLGWTNGFSINGMYDDIETINTVFCDSIECVENNLSETGIKNVRNIYRIEYSNTDATIRKVKIKFKATLE